LGSQAPPYIFILLETLRMVEFNTSRDLRSMLDATPMLAARRNGKRGIGI
jgi:hypothetical protein